MKFNPPILREFVQPDESDAFIWWLFRRRCVSCKQSATEINHIIPRSRDKSKIHDWHNKVTLCQICHEKYHSGGVTEDKIKELQDQRLSFLFMIGRSEYIEFENGSKILVGDVPDDKKLRGTNTKYINV